MTLAVSSNHPGNTRFVGAALEGIILSVAATPHADFAVQVRRIAGLDKHKLELKYDTFSQVSAIEQEARFGKYYKFKSSINSFSVCLMLSIKNCEL
jgi:hypothetical protein